MTHIYICFIPLTLALLIRLHSIFNVINDNQEKEVEAMTKRARKKFRQLDADGNGTLEGDEASTSTHA